MTPAANLIGVGGCRSPSLVQIQANTSGQDDDEHRVDRLHPADRHLPAEDVAVQLLVGVIVTTVNCCWYSDQNTALTMNIGMNEYTRRRSIVVIFLLLRITAK